MTLGNVVSATGSGLACPDWPLCHGRLIPPLRADVLIEYGHRVAAGVTSLLLVATVVLSLRRADGLGARRGRALGIVLLGLLGVQIGLGGITVLLGLPHLISTAHLVNALLIFAGLLAVSDRSEASWPTPERLRRLAVIGLAVLLFQLALGGYVRHSGAGLACPDFPLCAGAVLPDRWPGVAHWVHRWLGVALLGFFVHLAVASRRHAMSAPAGLALALAIVQVTLGILAVLLRLSPPVRASHAAIGYALWGVLVWIALRAGAWPGRASSAPIPPRSLTGPVRVS
jgi:heme A synthase